MTQTRKILGTTDEITTCSLCGRDDLKLTVVIDFVDADGNPEGELDYFGSDCASKIFTGQKDTKVARQIMTEALKADKARHEAERQARIAQADAERKIADAPFYAWVTETFGFTCRNHGDIYDNLRLTGRKTPYQLRAEFDAR